MKICALLSKPEKELHLLPGQKVVPAAAFSHLQEIVDIVEQARREEEEFKKAVAIEAEQQKQQAYERGYDEGLRSLNKHIVSMDEAVKQTTKEMQTRLFDLAIKAARKIVGEELRLHPDRIVDIVIKTLKPISQHHKIVLYVNRLDLETLEKNKAKIKNIFEHLDSFTIQERNDVEPGGCIIETEAGIINAQLENQWRALEHAFESFKKG